MNSIAYDIKTKAIIDPYRGQEDIRSGLIRAVSPRFCEDPIRALRAARQAAEFNFEITDDTLLLMNKCKQELLLEPGERFVAELTKALKAQKPTKFFDGLEKADLLDVCFGEIADLTEIKHFKGTSFTMLLEKLDKIATINNKIEIRFATVINGLAQTEGSFDCAKGLVALARFNQQLRLPKKWMEIVEFLLVSKEKIKIIEKKYNSGDVVELLLSLNKSPVEKEDLSDFLTINNMTVPSYINNSEKIIEELLEVKGSMAPTGLLNNDIAKWIRKEQIDRYEKITPNQNTNAHYQKT